MDRTNGAGNVGRMFVAEDIATNRPPTEVTAAWMNAVQEEIAGAIEGSGAALNPASNAQLLAAIRALAQTQGDARYAKLAGLATQLFSVAPATAVDNAVNLGQFAKSLTASGYQKLPGGLIFQWGFKVSVAPGAGSPLIFPIAFPTAFCAGAVMHPGAGVIYAQIVNPGSGGGTLVHSYSSAVPLYWLAIGY